MLWEDELNLQSCELGKAAVTKLWVLAWLSLKRHFENSCEKGAVAEGSIQGLRIESQDGPRMKTEPGGLI